MRYLAVLFCLFAFCLPASAQCPCGPACKCDPCVCGVDGVLDSGDESLAVLLSVAAKKTDAEVYAEAYTAALAANKVLVIGVGCETPPGDWLSCRVEALASYATGTVIVAKSDGKQLVVAGKLLAGASTAAVVQAVATPQATFGSPVSYGSVCGPNGCGPQMGGQMMFGGGCAGGNCGVPMMGGFGGFGGFMGGFGGGCAGGRCGG